MQIILLADRASDRNDVTYQISGGLAQKGNEDQAAQVIPYTPADKNSSGGETGPVVTRHCVTQSCVEVPLSTAAVWNEQ